MESVAQLLAIALNHLRTGDQVQAETLYLRVLELDAINAVALHQLGIMAHGKGVAAEAEQFVTRAAAAAPANDLYRNNLGVIQEARGDLTAAAKSYAAAIAINPHRAQVHFNLGNVLRSLGRTHEALASFRQAMAIEPNLAPALHNLGALLKELGQYAEAESVLRRAVDVCPDLTDAWVNLAAALQALDRDEEARAAYQRALEIQPGYPDAVAGLASLQLRAGDTNEAIRTILPLLPADASHPEVATVFAGLARNLRREEEAVQMLNHALENPSLVRSQRQTLHFSLGKLLDSLGHYDDAFEHFTAANALQTNTFDYPRFKDWITRIISTYTADYLATAARADIDSRIPVFVVGMPRSGTSLVEQILASHPLCFGAGERLDIDQLAHSLPANATQGTCYPDGIRTVSAQTLTAAANEYLARLHRLAPEAQRIVDKMPGNFAHLGFIAQLFPAARIIHVRRNPLDTCLSCYFQHFSTGHEYASDLKMLGHVYRDYERLMAHWRPALPLPVLELQYETLIAEPERETRRLLEFCGLEWDADCLRFHETRRIVRTASFDQVRQPLYSHSVEKHRRYERFLGPLKQSLNL